MGVRNLGTGQLDNSVIFYDITWGHAARAAVTSSLSTCLVPWFQWREVRARRSPLYARGLSSRLGFNQSKSRHVKRKEAKAAILSVLWQDSVGENKGRLCPIPEGVEGDPTLSGRVSRDWHKAVCINGFASVP